MSRRAALRREPSSDRSHAGSSGSRSGRARVSAAGAPSRSVGDVSDRGAFPSSRFEPPVARFGVAARREARGESAAPSDRAASMSARAAVRDGNGPRTSGNPSSFVRSSSTTTHVPDWGSIVKRPSRLSHRPPPSRLSDADSAMPPSINERRAVPPGDPRRHHEGDARRPGDPRRHHHEGDARRPHMSGATSLTKEMAGIAPSRSISSHGRHRSRRPPVESRSPPTDLTASSSG